MLFRKLRTDKYPCPVFDNMDIVHYFNKTYFNGTSGSGSQIKMG